MQLVLPAMISRQGNDQTLLNYILVEYIIISNDLFFAETTNYILWCGSTYDCFFMLRNKAVSEKHMIVIDPANHLEVAKIKT